MVGEAQAPALRKRSAAVRRQAAVLVLVAVAAEGVARAACDRSLWVHLRLPPRLQRIELVGSGPQAAPCWTAAAAGSTAGRRRRSSSAPGRRLMGWDGPTDVVIRKRAAAGLHSRHGNGAERPGRGGAPLLPAGGTHGRAAGGRPVARILISGGARHRGLRPYPRLPGAGVTGVTVERCSFERAGALRSNLFSTPKAAAI
jgi:hypothetical protein